MQNFRVYLSIAYIIVFGLGLWLGIEWKKPETQSKRPAACMYIRGDGSVTKEYTGQCVCMFEDYSAVVSCKVEEE